MQIKFVQTCDVGGVRYIAGSDVDAGVLPPDWLTGALKQGFVVKVDADTPQPKSNPADTEPPQTPVPENNLESATT